MGGWSPELGDTPHGRRAPVGSRRHERLACTPGAAWAADQSGALAFPNPLSTHKRSARNLRPPLWDVTAQGGATFLLKHSRAEYRRSQDELKVRPTVPTGHLPSLLPGYSPAHTHPSQPSATPRGRKRLPSVRPGHTRLGHNRRSGSAHACSITAPHVHTHMHTNIHVHTERHACVYTHV